MAAPTTPQTQDPNTPASVTSANATELLTKAGSGGIGTTIGEGIPSIAFTDLFGNTWVNVAADAPMTAAAAMQTNFFTQLLTELRRVNKILGLMAIYQGVELPDEFNAVLSEDDVTN
jgi:hypothetical protein